MDTWGCGHWPSTDGPPCGEPVKWFGTFRVGAWRAHVPLCNEHARHFHLMQKAFEKAAEATGFVITSVPIQLIEEIYSFEFLHERYTGAPQIWTCSECGHHIVRSLESGRWLAVDDERGGRLLLEMALHPHEHVPG